MTFVVPIHQVCDWISTMYIKINFDKLVNALYYTTLTQLEMIIPDHIQNFTLYVYISNWYSKVNFIQCISEISLINISISDKIKKNLFFQSIPFSPPYLSHVNYIQQTYLTFERHWRIQIVTVAYLSEKWCHQPHSYLVYDNNVFNRQHHTSWLL